MPHWHNYTTAAEQAQLDALATQLADNITERDAIRRAKEVIRLRCKSRLEYKAKKMGHAQ